MNKHTKNSLPLVLTSKPVYGTPSTPQEPPTRGGKTLPCSLRAFKYFALDTKNLVLVAWLPDHFSLLTLKYAFSRMTLHERSNETDIPVKGTFKTNTCWNPSAERTGQTPRHTLEPKYDEGRLPLRCVSPHLLPASAACGRMSYVALEFMNTQEKEKATRRRVTTDPR